MASDNEYGKEPQESILLGHQIPSARWSFGIVNSLAVL